MGRAAVVRSLVGAVSLAAVLLGWGSSQTVTTSPQTSAPAQSFLAASPPDNALEEADSSSTGSPPLHITYGAVEMDQAVLPLSPTEQETSLGSIVPPYTADAYWLTPYGVPGAWSTNTTYIVGHSWDGRASPFNNISSLSQPGDVLTVTTAEGPVHYKIDRVTTEYKDTLKDSAIWDKAPGRLVLITCFMEDLRGKNIIIQASPLPAA